MVHKDENITIKVDHNNLIYIDPNSVTNNGVTTAREVKNEDLTYFVNLEADITPRTKLIMDEKPTMETIATGILNLMRTKNPDGDFSAAWTNSFFDNVTEGNDADIFTRKLISEETFGIESINIQIKPGMVPTIVINFVDIRGKTLFENPENSPYQAFFHMPWPVFYLTVKGYYGKAVKYKLHMVRFVSSFDDNGNFNIKVDFVGSTFAFMNDIPISAVLNAPYMYVRETVTVGNENTKTGNKEQKIVKQTKGHNILKSVYSEMKQKKIIPEDFPIRTIKELNIIASSLDTILERQIFKDVIDMAILGAMQEYSRTLDKYYSQVDAWEEKYADKSSSKKIDDIFYYPLRGKGGAIKGNVNGSIEYIINNNNSLLKNSALYNNELQRGKKIKFDNSILSNPIDFGLYYKVFEETEYFSTDRLKTDIKRLNSTFREQRNKVEKEVEVKMNEVISSAEGIGFKPTIRNLFAIILANAEVFIRLMKEVHNKAFEENKNRTKVIGGFDSDSSDANVYPWPELRKTISTSKSKVIIYPGDKDVRNQLRSDDANLWPEVEFVEEYVSVATNVKDALNESENGVNDFDFNMGNGLTRTEKITDAFDDVSYYDRTLVPFMYEIYERAKTVVLNNEYDKNILKDLVNVEFENIRKSLEEESEIVSVLRAIFEPAEEFEGMDVVQKFEYILKSYSLNDRHLLKVLNEPTTTYIKDIENKRFSVESEIKDAVPFNESLYGNFSQNVKKMDVGEEIEVKYPFSSSLYKSYLKPDTSTNVGRFFDVRKFRPLVSSIKDKTIWFKKNDLVNNKLLVNGYEENVLNTHFFHKQLYFDQMKGSDTARFAGTAYLFLTSLPLIDLSDNIKTADGSIPLYKLFTTTASAHYIPYLQLLRWGAIYHRYRVFIETGKDLLWYIVNDGKTNTINRPSFYNNGQSFSFTDGNHTFNDNADAGIHPFYDALFHQVVRGYNHYDVIDGNRSYSTNCANGTIINTRTPLVGNKMKWTSYVVNNKFKTKDDFITLLPSCGANRVKYDNESDLSDTNKHYNRGFRIVWEDGDGKGDTEGIIMPTPKEYFNSVTGDYATGSEYKKVIDLIATFPHDLLNYMENLFLNFSDSNNQRTDGVDDYISFQQLLSDIVTVDGGKDDVESIKNKQRTKLKLINEKLLNGKLYEVTLKNPRGFTYANMDRIAEPEKYGISGLRGDSSITGPRALKTIELYIGEDVEGHYLRFFQIHNIEINTENVIKYKPIVYLFAGLNNDRIFGEQKFRTYIGNVMGKAEKKYHFFMTMLLNRFSELKMRYVEKGNVDFVDGYNNTNYKIDLYNSFKTFNDKWISGNSIPRKLLIEDFLFLDKSNRDIGDNTFLNIDRIATICDPRNAGLTLYGALNSILADSGLDIRTLPTYTNFYTTRSSASIAPSENVANDVFGIFNEIDYEDSDPKTIVQYVGNVSKYVSNMNKEFGYEDDRQDLFQTINNSYIVTSPQEFKEINIEKSNKVVAFEVSFGDQNQGIFSKLSLSQENFKNTAESFYVSDQVARSNTGSGTKSVDISLFNLYSKQSYTCGITAMGNMMIQPTMFFQLRNVPMFKGAYWITDVNHTIGNDGFVTSFNGVRISKYSLPDPHDSFMSSYKSLFDRIMNKNKVNSGDGKITTERTYTRDGEMYITDPGTVRINGETETRDTVKVGETKYGVPYNGFADEKYIQKVNYKGKEYLRATVGRMHSNNARLNLTEKVTFLNLLSDSYNNYNGVGVHGMEWADLVAIMNTQDFYCVNVNRDKRPDDVARYKTEFVNPMDGDREIRILPQYNLDRRNGKTVSVSGMVNYNKTGKYGILMSPSLMRKLNLHEGDVVYFNHY